MNANLVHKFPITDEEYNPVEEGVLNVKQRVANESPSSRSVTCRGGSRGEAWSES